MYLMLIFHVEIMKMFNMTKIYNQYKCYRH